MTTQSKPRRMTVAEFLDWASAQPGGRYELVWGEVVRLPSERAGHCITKGEVWHALDDAIERTGVACHVFGSGAAVVVDEQTVRDPDCSVQRKAAYDPDALVLEAPLIVVEVSWPSMRDDAEAKLAEYFSVPSIQHYLIVDPVKKIVIHHARGRDRQILTPGDEIDLTPPGMTVPAAGLLPELE
jgi:Uma2 family endonuclease